MSEIPLVTENVLDTGVIRSSIQTDESGAVIVFEGVVRNHHEGHSVVRLEYEAYVEMAATQISHVRDEILSFFGEREVYEVMIQHRVGTLDIGDTSLIVAVSAAHRADAFEAALRAVDRVKETVPVWKKEWSLDGAEWQEGIKPKP
jgi:molybdopterin synthase catalytic subunit